MSDPVSNAEIEDVLSSIRRLVSQRTDAPEEGAEDTSKTQGAKLSEVKTQAGEATAPTPALVLTPSLRVSEPKTKTLEVEPDTSGDTDSETRDLSERVAGLEAAMDAAEGQWEPDGSEEQNLPTELPWRMNSSKPEADSSDVPAAPMAVDVPQEPESAEIVETVLESLGASETSNSFATDETDKVAAEIDTSEPEAIFAEPGEEEGGLPSDSQDIVEGAEPQAAVADDAETFVFHSERAAASWPEEEDETEETPPEDPDDFGADSEELTDPPISLRLHLIKGGGGPEIVGANVADAAVRQFSEVAQEPDSQGAEEWQDADTSLSSPEGATSQIDDDDDEDDDLDLSFLDEPEDLLDEEELRVMVADIVREELRGELGEKITHTLRKMVRREISRALSARELE